ncbi:cytochrome c [Xanthomonas sp. SI]|uniref:c-type cytochrome n=1 Tax=Xanthomonas sp. SI TaxID=2724123 RepID=UPI00163B2A0B|nr:cytochrome c [Xanthomonas sp. SI]QNH11470.1 cytochrome C6 [Xanthomonas sp. SI]
MKLDRHWVLAAAVAAAVLALMLPPAIGPAAAQSSDATPLYPQAAFATASGATVYAAICQSCHMPGGQGARGGGEYPALAGNPKVAAAPYVAMMVLDGRGGMPGFAGMLNDQQVAEVVHYVRSQFGNDYPGKLSADEVRTLRH